MATMILLPDGSSGHTSHWVENTGTHHFVLQSDDGDTSYVACSAYGRQLILTFANPSVLEASISSITSVRFLSSGRHTGRSGGADVSIAFNAPTFGFAEAVNYNSSPTTYETINGTARTTSDGSSAWTYSDLENLQMRMTKVGTDTVRISYLALEVTYVEAGYGNDVLGVDSGDITSINGIAVGNISKVNGV